MKQSNRTIVFQAGAMEHLYRLCVKNRAEYHDLLDVNTGLELQLEEYRKEINRRKRAAKAVFLAASTFGARRKLQAVYRAAMEEK